jgi:hypothetical protein
MRTIDQMVVVYICASLALLAARQSIIGITFCYLTCIKSVFDRKGSGKGHAFESSSGGSRLESLKRHRLHLFNIFVDFPKHFTPILGWFGEPSKVGSNS